MTTAATFGDMLRLSRFAYVAGYERTSARPADPFWRASYDLGVYHRMITEAAPQYVESAVAAMP